MWEYAKSHEHNPISVTVIPRKPPEVFRNSKNDYQERREIKHTYEHMARAILVMLSSLEGIEFVEKYKLFSEDENENKDAALGIFVKNVCRYMRAHKRRQEADCKMFVDGCYKNLQSNQDLFDFRNLTEYNANICPEIDDWTEYYRGYFRETPIRKDVASILSNKVQRRKKEKSPSDQSKGS